MKKITSVLLMIMIVLAIAACGSEEAPSTGNGEQPVSEVPAETEQKEDGQQNAVAENNEAVPEVVEQANPTEETPTAEIQPDAVQPAAVTPDATVENSNPVANQQTSAPVTAEPSTTPAQNGQQPATSETKVAPKTETVSPKTEKVFTLGANDGKEYINNYWGLKFVLPAGWNFVAAEKVAEMNGLSGKAQGNEMQKAIEDARILYGMVAQSSNGSASLCFEKLDANMANVTEEQYLSASLAKTKEAMEKANVTNINIENGKISIGRTEVNAAQMSYTVEGKEIYQVLFCMKKDNRMATVGVSATSKDANNVALAAFHAAE